MPDIWRIYHVKNCPHTTPTKDKFVVIVCEDIEPLGFFINSTVNRFIQNRPKLLNCQVLIKSSDYGFLAQDSYIDCTKLYPFDDEYLVSGRECANDETKKEIKTAVSNAVMLEKRYRDMILNNP
jgi:hypothetical protein